MSNKRKPYLKTVGELRKALEKFPDNMPLAIDDRGIGWGLAPPYIGSHQWFGEMHTGYYTPEQVKELGKKIRAKPLEEQVCVLEPSAGA